MIDISSVIVLFILVIIILKQIEYIKKLKIQTRKSIGEIIVVVVFVLAIFLMTILLAKSIIHYFIATLGVILLFLDVKKQGISTDGILLVARGKELYYWKDISSAEINYKNKNLIVQYYSISGVKIVTHNYDNKYSASILKIFAENKVTIK